MAHNLKIPLEAIKNVRLTPVKDAGQREIVSQSLWQDKPALLVLIRRPGCLYCRNEAVELRKRQSEIEKQCGMRMVAIVNQKLGAKDFADSFWRGETYFDHDLGLFKAFGNGKLRRGSLLQLLNPVCIVKYCLSRRKMPEGNLKGDGTIYGGLLVVGAGEKGVQYAYPERKFGDIAPIEDVISACHKISQ